MINTGCCRGGLPATEAVTADTSGILMIPLLSSFRFMKDLRSLQRSKSRKSWLIDAGSKSEVKTLTYEG